MAIPSMNWDLKHQQCSEPLRAIMRNKPCIKMLSVKGSLSLQFHLHQNAPGLVKSTEQRTSINYFHLGARTAGKKIKSFKSSTVVIFGFVLQREKGKPLEYLKHVISARLTNTKRCLLHLATAMKQPQCFKQRLNNWEEIAKH